MIDLRKVGLLDAFLQLPFNFVMPDTLFEDEWLDLDEVEREDLIANGLQVESLDPEGVRVAAKYSNEYPRLKLNDCFALTLAESIDESILLTGDGLLRTVAIEKVEVHGVLWVTDSIETHELASHDRLLSAITKFIEDPLVYLPENELKTRLKHYQRILRT